MFRSPLPRILSLLLLAFSGGLPVHAQVNTASLSGLATDPSGAALPHATVTATDDATGYSRVVRTDAAGAYSLQDLPIGEYSLTVNAPGFSSISEQITLAVGQRAREDFHLQMGATQQTVQVEAATALLSPDDASISTVVGATTIEETPLSLRNWDDLLRVVPGVQINRYHPAERRHLGRPRRRFQCQRRSFAAKQFHPRRHRQQHLL